MSIELRDYQKECVAQIDGEGKEGRHLIAMATGLGKTAVFTSIQRRGRTLILSHRDELVRQPEKYYEGCSFGVEKAEERANGEDIVSASVQSLSKDSRLLRYAPDDFYTIIVDEAHHAAAPSYRKILDFFSGAKQVIGVTATPKRNDGVRLTDVFDDILFTRDLRWGILNGWLSDIRCERVTAFYTLCGVKITAGDFNSGELDGVLNPKTFAIAAKTYVDACHNQGRHTLIYCPSINACISLQGVIRNLLPEKEKRTIRVLTGNTDPDKRKEILQGFQAGEVRCIINCMVLTEGTDLPICDTVINLRPTCNPSLYQQMIGRGTRLYEGKDYCLIIDIIPSDERKIQNLCTAPTLFGIDPALLPEKITERFDKNHDLMDLCDEIAGTIGAATLTAERMEVSVALAETFVQGQTEIILGSSKGAANYKTAAQRLSEHAAQELAGYGLDFGDLYVTVRPEEERRFMIKPNWDETIYVSVPDVLGNVTVDFHVYMRNKEGLVSQTRRAHYSQQMRFDEALELIRKYCMLMPEYLWYSWNRKLREAWDRTPATDKQKKRTELCYKDLGNDWRGIDNLTKLEASNLIDAKLEIDKKLAYAKEFKIAPRQRQATKDKKTEQFREREAAKQESILQGRQEFPEFRNVVEKEYKALLEHQAQSQREEERLKEEAANGEPWIFSIDVTVRRYSGKATDKQDGFIQSLFSKAARRGYVFTEKIRAQNFSRAEASLMIDALLQLSNYPIQAENFRFVFDMDCFVREIGRVLAFADGSRQTIELEASEAENVAT